MSSISQVFLDVTDTYAVDVRSIRVWKADEPPGEMALDGLCNTIQALSRNLQAGSDERLVVIVGFMDAKPPEVLK